VTLIDVDVHEQADLSSVLAVHRALTEDALSLARVLADLSPDDRAERIPAIRRYFAAYRAQLASHHRHEDEVFFPALEAKIGADAISLERLATQHRDLAEAVDRLGVALDAVGDEGTEFVAAKARAVAVADDLVGRLGENIGYEQAEVFPAFVLAVTQTENVALQARALTREPFERLFFMVPWLYDRIPNGARQATLVAAPEVLKMIYLGHAEEYRDLAQALHVR
jgi:hemerythrin-like domain-containing protein